MGLEEVLGRLHHLHGDLHGRGDQEGDGWGEGEVVEEEEEEEGGRVGVAQA